MQFGVRGVEIDDFNKRKVRYDGCTNVRTKIPVFLCGNKDTTISVEGTFFTFTASKIENPKQDYIDFKSNIRNCATIIISLFFIKIE